MNEILWFGIGVAATFLVLLLFGFLANRKARKLRYYAGVLFQPEREMLKRADVRPIVPEAADDMNVSLMEELGMVERLGNGRYAVTPFGKEVGRFIEAKESYRVN